MDRLSEIINRGNDLKAAEDLEVHLDVGQGLSD